MHVYRRDIHTGRQNDEIHGVACLAINGLLNSIEPAIDDKSYHATSGAAKIGSVQFKPGEYKHVLDDSSAHFTEVKTGEEVEVPATTDDTAEKEVWEHGDSFKQREVRDSYQRDLAGRQEDSIDQLSGVVRAREFDTRAKAFLTEHPDGSVVDLGCGHDTRLPEWTTRGWGGLVSIFLKSLTCAGNWWIEGERSELIPTSMLDFHLDGSVEGSMGLEFQGLNSLTDTMLVSLFRSTWSIPASHLVTRHNLASAVIRPSLNAPQLSVVSRHADGSLWLEPLNAGAYDVLPKLLEAAETQRVMASGWRE